MFRELTLVSQEVMSEAGRALASPTRRVAACGVLQNPYAGMPAIDDFTDLVALSVKAGERLTESALAALAPLSRAATARGHLLAPPAILSMAPA